jgi:hypothetical protein
MVWPSRYCHQTVCIVVRSQRLCAVGATVSTVKVLQRAFLLCLLFACIAVESIDSNMLVLASICCVPCLTGVLTVPAVSTIGPDTAATSQHSMSQHAALSQSLSPQYQQHASQRCVTMLSCSHAVDCRKQCWSGPRTSASCRTPATLHNCCAGLHTLIASSVLQFQHLAAESYPRHKTAPQLPSMIAALAPHFFFAAATTGRR